MLNTANDLKVSLKIYPDAETIFKERREKMKKIFIMFLCLFSTGIKGQVDPSVIYDPTTGNYIIEYEGHEGENEEPVLVHRIFEPSTKIDPLIKAIATKVFDSSYFRYN